MAGIMGKVSSLLERESPAVKQIRKEIEATQFKRDSLISSVQGEINDMNRKINEIMLRIGRETYEAYKSEKTADLDVCFKEVDSFKEKIGEKEAKIKEITDRYNDELSMMSAHLADTKQKESPQAAQQPPPPAQSAGAFCKNCGKQCAPTDTFCMGCGNRLQ